MFFSVAAHLLFSVHLFVFFYISEDYRESGNCHRPSYNTQLPSQMTHHQRLVCAASQQSASIGELITDASDTPFLASLIAPRVSFFLLLLFLSFFFLFLFTEDTDDDKRSHPKLIRRPRRLGFADILFLPLRRIRRRLLMEYKCLPSRHFLSLLRAHCCLYNMADMLNCF
jgi:hypothetical protein